MSEHQSLLVQTLKYGEERRTQSLRCEGFENYKERRTAKPKHTKTHQHKVVWYEWLGNGGERRRPSKFRRKKTIDRGGSWLHVHRSYLQLRWSWTCPQVNWPSVLKVHWLALLACLHRPVSRGWSAREGSPGRLSRRVHSQIFHSRLQVDNGRRRNRLTACVHATSRAKCSLEIASFNLWTWISCHTEGMLGWWK